MHVTEKYILLENLAKGGKQKRYTMSPCTFGRSTSHWTGDAFFGGDKKKPVHFCGSV